MMASITAPMQALSLDQAPASTPPPKPPAQVEKQAKPRRASRPDQVDPEPLPSLEEWRAVKAVGDMMYYGFYADEDTLQRMLINRFPKQLGHKDPTNDALLYPALLYLRDRFKRPDLSVHLAVLPQRAKDLNPEIEDDVGEEVIILALFALEEESYLNRMTQKEVDKLARYLGKKPTWWHVTHSMPDI